MSNFPYNNEHYSGPIELVNGSPITMRQALELASEIYTWHNIEKETSDWTQSHDGATEDITQLAWGLIELLADPGAIRRLITTGAGVYERTATFAEYGQPQNRAMVEHSLELDLAVYFGVDPKETENQMSLLDAVRFFNEPDD